MTSNPSNCITLSQTLIAAKETVDGPKVSWDTVGRAFNASAATGGRILSGEKDGQCEDYRSALCSPIGDSVAAALTCGTPFRFVRVVPQLDTDGDGTIDKGDAEFGFAKAAQTACKLVTNSVASSDGRHYTAAECVEAQRLKDELHQQIEDAFAVVVRHTPTSPRLTA